jgi:tetratricopeptide (TPR) repeat protein
LPPDNKAKEEMLTACRHHYQNNRGRLKVIDEFDQTYHINECIRWYTKETFVYELINSALRTGDIEKLYTFRYYIADLSNQLAEKSKNSKWGRDQLINLYRGTKINKKEADKFKINDGKLIATNSYWSTSRDRDYACTYANKLAHHADLVSVLFEIECSLMNQNDSIVVVDISELSEFPSENEFLFDVGSIFQIQKVTKETNGDTELYVVELSTTEDGREVVKKYIEENRREMEYESPKMMVGILLKRIGEYKKSLQYFEQLLIDPGEENIAYIHNRIGIAYRNENKDDLALDHFNKALSLSSKVQPSEKRLLANILQNIGKVDYKHKRFNSALEYYRQAVDTIGPEKGDMNRLIAELYSSIGRVSIDLKDYESAHKHLQNALEIRQSCLPSDHFINAFSYADIAKIYWCQKNPELALENHRKALELRQNYLPANHINTAWSLHYVGKMYYKNRNLETALDYYLKSLEMTRKCLPPPQHHTVPKILESIALIYNDKKNFNEALEYRFEALEVQKKTEPIDYSNLAHILDNIAFTYRLMNRKKDSLTFYQKALQVLTDNLSDDNLNLSYTFKHLASLYEAMNDIRSALIYYRKELKIYQHHRLYRDKRYKKTRRNIKRLSMHKI